MKSNAKYFLITFVLMIIFNLGVHYLLNIPNFGEEINPHLGVLFISGIIFGPYGIIGAVIANFICDLVKGYSLNIAILSEIMSFLIGYLGYKLWYSKNEKNTKPRLNNRINMLIFFIIALICATLYSLLVTKMTYLTYPNTIGLYYVISIQYFVNFVNFSLAFGIITIGLLHVKDFSYTPKLSNKGFSNKFYNIIGLLLLVSCVSIIILDNLMPASYYLNAFETLLILVLITIFITRPIRTLKNIPYTPIPEKIINRFLVLTLLLIIIGIISLFEPIIEYTIDLILDISKNQFYLLMVLLIDMIVIIYLIPSYFIIRYVETKVVNPLISFSKIESRIKVDEKIELNDLIDVYSMYSNQDDEIGMLSRSHIDLVEQNNTYIENIKKIESEKQRIQTELDIAHRIQEAILPSDIIENDTYKIKGYSKPAKEVGGDFYDYYEIDDDKLVIVIGDSSGKGVPAALFSTITQNSIQQHFHYEQNPAKILYDINNRMSKNNSEFMFITLWLGVYDKKDKKLVYANAGHNHPLIKKDNEYVELLTKPGVVIGINENFEFINEEIVLDGDLILYTDGITDARNKNRELYGEERLINYLNQRSEEHIIDGLIEDVEKYCDGMEQYDDMTIVHMITF